MPDFRWRQVLARILAHAAKRPRPSGWRGRRAEVLAAAQRCDEAEAALEEALDRAERKQNLARARQIFERLVELRAETQPAL